MTAPRKMFGPRYSFGRLVLLAVAVIAACAPGFAQENFRNEPRPEHGLQFNTPVTVWDEALPLGNGMIGALVWGDGRPLRISLDRSDLWDLRPVPEFHSPEYTFTQMRRWHEEGRTADLVRLFEKPYERPAPTKIPAGRIEITLSEAARFASSRLDLKRASAGVRFRGARKEEAEVFVHATEPVGMIRLKSPDGFNLRLVAPPFAGKVRDAAKGDISAGDLQQLGYSAPVETSGENWRAYTQEGWNDFRFAVYIAWRRSPGAREEWQAAWSIASSFEGPEPLAVARARAERALQVAGFEAMRESHERWWEAFWRKSSIRVPNPVLERQWFLDTYKFGATARRGAPPISLQAIWTADNGQLPPWKGDFHHDLNTQLSYWPAYSGNRLEEQLSFLDWLWRTRENGKKWTQRFFNMPGLNMPMTTDLDGNQIGGWRQYTHSATTAAWLAHHFYLHWRYSGDRKFLRERAYPYLRDASTFIEAYTAHKGPNGRRTHPLSSSPEINDNLPEAWFASVTNYDLALNRWLLGATAELADELGEAAEARHWRQVLSEFPNFALGEDGRLLVAADYPLKESHRHFSHLMAIHPLGLIDSGAGPREAEIVAASLKDLDRLGTNAWVGYSFAWLASFAARAGDGWRAERALGIFSTAFTLRNSFHCNGDQSGLNYSRYKYRPFTLEGNFASAAGLQEMLLQTHRRKIELFPAVPASWKNASFSQLRAEGAFLVSAKFENREIVAVEIVSEKGGLCRLSSPFISKDIELSFKPGERRLLDKQELSRRD
jgi:alpha-L-fucosidase 2